MDGGKGVECLINGYKVMGSHGRQRSELAENN